MKQILVGGCAMVLALIVMDTTQVVTTPSGLTVKGGQALAADMPPRRRPSPRQLARGKRQLAKGKGRSRLGTKCPVRRVLESSGLVVISGRWPDSTRGSPDVDERKPRAL